MTVMSGPSYAAWAGHGSKFGNLTLADSVPPEMSHLIDPHWYQFPPINPMWYPLVGFVIGVLGIISVIGNGMVVYIFCSTKSLRTPSNMFVINLAFSDFLMMFTMSPPLMCQVYALLGSLFGCGSIWTMTLIAFDRYNVIVKGLSGKPLSINGALLRIIAIWLFSLFWTVAPEGNLTACGTDYLSKAIENTSYILVYSVFVYYLPLFMIIYSYYFIIQAVAAHEKNMREQAKKMNVASLRSSENANTSAECKLAKVALMTISLWFMAWTPYLVINYTGIFDTQKITPIFTIWGSIFAKANAVYNPIVYGISHPKYRAALFQRFPSLACANEPAPCTDATSTASGVTTVPEGEKPSA